jgi:hypothetical protein
LIHDQTFARKWLNCKQFQKPLLTRYTPFVLTSRAVLMQRITDRVRHGFTHWCAGTTATYRVPALAEKMAANYGVDADRNERARTKRAGRGSAMLLLLSKNDDFIRWWLQVTPPHAGPHPAHIAERLVDATQPRTRIELDGYELLQLPIKSRISKETTVRWTWRMNPSKYEGWRDAVIDAVRNRASRGHVHDLLYGLFEGSPGFAGVRIQVGKLAALYRHEWARRRGNELLVPLPRRLGYVRRLATGGIRLHALVAQTKLQTKRSDTPYNPSLTFPGVSG